MGPDRNLLSPIEDETKVAEEHHLLATPGYSYRDCLHGHSKDLKLFTRKHCS